MDYRDELDRMAHIHGYEDREDEPSCSECIHNKMCSGNNCNFERAYSTNDLIPRFYHVNDFESRLDDRLLNEKDKDEIAKEWPRDLDGPYFATKSEWEKHHPIREWRVRISVEVAVDARDEMDARTKACQQLYLDPNDERLEVSDLSQYRMPVEYRCCEEGRTYGYEYTYAANPREAQYKLMEKYCGDIESSPCPNDIEMYDEEGEEWFHTWTRRIEE